MSLISFLSLSAWSMALAVGWSTRREGLTPVPAGHGTRIYWALAGMFAAVMAHQYAEGVQGMQLLLGSTAAIVVIQWLGSSEKSRMARWRDESRQMAWIIQQRGSVQDQIMRACEREAMERRLRRCQATLMLTRRGGQDLSLLFRRLEERVEDLEHRPMEAAALVGAFAAHLRHVFMESDRDDISVTEACSHVDRWAAVIRALGASEIHIDGAPPPSSDLAKRRIPAMLILGATERLGVSTLVNRNAAPALWRWTFGRRTVKLESEGGAPLMLPSEEYRDWDAAFMLRHGGIAHAGGSWSFELPLLPD